VIIRDSHRPQYDNWPQTSHNDNLPAQFLPVFNLKFERNIKGTMKLMLLAVLIFAAVEVHVSTHLFYKIKITWNVVYLRAWLTSENRRNVFLCNVSTDTRLEITNLKNTRVSWLYATPIACHFRSLLRCVRAVSWVG
jgi:hypothetical protein